MNAGRNKRSASRRKRSPTARRKRSVFAPPHHKHNRRGGRVGTSLALERKRPVSQRAFHLTPAVPPPISLDVFHAEPIMPDHPLARPENVTLSPDTVFRTLEVSENLLRRVLDIVRKVQGYPPV